MPLRFSGQETAIVLLNSTTGDQLLPDILAKDLNFSIKTEEKTDSYLGQVGPTIDTFYDGYEFTLNHDPRSAVTLVEFMNIIIAKLQRQILDEFAVRAKFGSPDAGNFAVTFVDVKWSSPSFTMGGQKDLLAKSIKGMGNKLTFQRL